MARLNTIRSLDLVVIMVLIVGLIPYTFYETASGCSEEGFSAFNFWRRGLTAPLTIMVAVTGLFMLMWLRNRGLRLIHIILSSIIVVYFIVILVLDSVELGYANRFPNATEGGTFDNTANDIRYCCTFEFEAAEGDCPPLHNSCVDLNTTCAIVPGQADLSVNGDFLWRYIFNIAFLAFSIVAIALAVVIRQIMMNVGDYEMSGDPAIFDMKDKDVLYSESRIGNRENMRHRRRPATRYTHASVKSDHILENKHQKETNWAAVARRMISK